MNKTKAERAKALEAATKACHDHVKSCWLCRWGVLSIFIQCRTIQGLLFDHMAAKANIDIADWEEKSLEFITEAPTVDDLEKLYRL